MLRHLNVGARHVADGTKGQGYILRGGPDPDGLVIKIKNLFFLRHCRF
jgi:hypothetical protein